MRFAVAVTSPSVAEREAAFLRREGSLARVDCGAPALVVVTCMKEDVDLIFRLVRATDEGAELQLPAEPPAVHL